MDDIMPFSALEIEKNLDKYFNSFGNLKVTDIQNSSIINVVIDSLGKFITVIGGDYTCANEATGNDIDEFIQTVLYS